MCRGLLFIATIVAIGLGTGIALAEKPPKPPREKRDAEAVHKHNANLIRGRLEKLERHREQLVKKKGLEKDHAEVREVSEAIERHERALAGFERQGRHQARRPEHEHAREMDQIRERLEQLARRRDELIDKKGFKEDHPEVREVGENMERLARELEALERRRHGVGRRPHPPGPGVFHLEAPWRRPPSPEVLEKLEAVLPEIEFDDVPLGQVIEFLREQRKININVEWRALDGVALDQETTVNMDRLTDVTLEMVLRTVLRNVAEERGQLGFYVEGNVVVITLAEHLPRPGSPPPPVEEILERLRHDRPEAYERLMELRRERPERFQHEMARQLAALRRTGPPHPSDEEEERRELEELRRHDPERYELTKRDDELTDRSVELAERIRRTEAPEPRGKLKEQLAKLLSHQFDVRMEIRRREIRGVARELDELRGALERRVRSKPELVERRMNELLNPEETEW